MFGIHKAKEIASIYLKKFKVFLQSRVSNKLPTQVKRNQVIMVVIFGALVISGAITSSGDNAKRRANLKAKVEAQQSNLQISLADSLDAVSTETTYEDMVENEQKHQKQELAVLKKSDAHITKKIEQLEKLFLKQAQEHRDQLKKQEKLHQSALAKQSKQLQSSVGAATLASSVSNPANAKVANVGVVNNRTITSINFSKKDEGSLKDSRYYIPAGAQADARITIGVDTSTSVGKASEPDMVELMITSPAIGAYKNGKSLETDILGCTVLAQAYGEIGSEKANMRLQTMTCKVGKNQFFEVPVKGIVANRGSSGVRGKVIHRDGELIRDSALAGFIGSAGKGAADYFSSPISALTGGRTEDTPAKDIFSGAVGAGIGDAASSISNYKLEQAKQRAPVISIQPYTNVTVVFQEGVALNGLAKVKRS